MFQPRLLERWGTVKTASAGASEKKKPRQPGRKKTRLPGRAHVRHHREHCGKQTWRSSEWAASQGQPKSAKSKPRQPGQQKPRQPGRRKNRVSRGGTKPRQPGWRENCVSRGERKKTRLPGRARVRHHREHCGKQTWRSSEWAASQGQPKSAKSEPRQPGWRKNRVSRGGTKPRQPGRHETASAGAARKLRQPGRKKKNASAGASPGAAPPGTLCQTDMAIE
ncbi:hypothetical protein MRX96_058769 [Rhipicephalus microplus]